MTSAYESKYLQKNGFLLQGLVGLPVGLWLIQVLTVRFIWPDFYQAWGGLFDLSLVPIVVLARFAIKRYYEKLGGAPDSVFRVSRGPWIVGVGALIAALGIGLTFGLAAGLAVKGVALGVAFLVVGREFSFHKVSGFVLIVASVVLTWRTEGVAPLLVVWSIIGLLFGCALIVGAVFEHMIYSRRPHCPS